MGRGLRVAKGHRCADDTGFTRATPKPTPRSSGHYPRRTLRRGPYPCLPPRPSAHELVPSATIASPRADRVALLVVQLGIVAVILVALPYKLFDLDRYFVPKELVLHLSAAIAALCCLLPRGRLALA